MPNAYIDHPEARFPPSLRNRLCSAWCASLLPTRSVARFLAEYSILKLPSVAHGIDCQTHSHTRYF